MLSFFSFEIEYYKNILNVNGKLHLFELFVQRKKINSTDYY